MDLKIAHPKGCKLNLRKRSPNGVNLRKFVTVHRLSKKVAKSYFEVRKVYNFCQRNAKVFLNFCKLLGEKTVLWYGERLKGYKKQKDEA